MLEHTLPDTQYAKSGNVHIAFQVMGNGPMDVILVPGMISHVEFLHEMPGYTDFLRRLATYARVITLDKRGQGLSDRMHGVAPLEVRMGDVCAVMDCVGSKRAALVGFSEGCAMSALLAASHPERISHLVMFGGFVRFADLLHERDDSGRFKTRMAPWGSGGMLPKVIKSHEKDDEFVRLFAKYERLSSSPGDLKAYLNMYMQVDVSEILKSIHVPTLVQHRADDALVPIALGRQMADAIPQARFIEYPGADHAFWSGELDELHADLEEFLTGVRPEHQEELERVLATVLFTDIVDSTIKVTDMGDGAWRKVLDAHDKLARESVARHRGQLVKSTGDGILARFDGPGRAVKCALALRSAMPGLGIAIRAGVHTGEVEIRGDDIGGIAVHAAARVMAQAQPGEVIVSRVVTDLVAGAGLSFQERGTFTLKGLPTTWDLYSAQD